MAAECDRGGLIETVDGVTYDLVDFSDRSGIEFEATKTALVELTSERIALVCRKDGGAYAIERYDEHQAYLQSTRSRSIAAEKQRRYRERKASEPADKPADKEADRPQEFSLTESPEKQEKSKPKPKIKTAKHLDSVQRIYDHRNKIEKKIYGSAGRSQPTNQDGQLMKAALVLDDWIDKLIQTGPAHYGISGYGPLTENEAESLIGYAVESYGARQADVAYFKPDSVWGRVSHHAKRIESAIADGWTPNTTTGEKDVSDLLG
jgi:hypothetical protein